ncbi:hypothetical protein GCM10008119_17290 [Pedobacter mendelii]|uniref:CusA/CzcA family heavy metal efflux RND transporter n=3 Tax=Pedobacter mendelii TaxID=1908240 RepID=A0ABQ2BK32_9SPHI|nr:hypothetical protein GCM10008119_17290 [Pedobacter mendelii]
MARLELSYHKTLSKVIGFPKTVLLTVLSLFIISIVTLTFLGGEFIPALEEGDFAVDTRVLTGSNISTTIESTQKAAHILKTQFPEVEKVVTKIGSGEVPTDPMPMEASDMMVILKDKKEWTSAKTFNELSEKMGKALEAVPGITAGFQYPVQMRFNELMTGARQDVVCKIFGENLDTLAIFAKKMGSIISKVDGAQDLFIEPVTGMPQVLISYNRALIAQYNLDITDVNRIVNTAFAGQSAGLIFEGEKRFQLVVRLDGEQRKNLLDIQNLLIPTPTGAQIPLSQLATVEIKNGPNQIQREDAKRRMVVGFNVRGRDVQTIVGELQEKVNSKIKFPPGYYVTYGGAFENLNAAKKRLMVAVPVSLVLIFILLFFAFGSVKQGLLIYSAIPLSAIGGIFFLALRGMPFSISAGVGFIALFGVAVLNGIVLIAEFNRLKKDGMADLKQIVLEGTKLRLRPVMMTAFVASLGFLPMALSNGAGAEVQRPLATVVIGGLMIATFLTLFVLPVLYIIFEKGAVFSLGKKVPVLVGFILVLCVGNAQAQQPISLSAAIDTAMKKSLMVKNQALMVKYQQQLIKTSTILPFTNFTGEFGQLNSAYNDNRFGLSQSFSFPTVYRNQKNLLNLEADQAITSADIKTFELSKTIADVFDNFLYLREKQKLILKSDSLYSQFLEKANIRFKVGESNIMEKATAETQKASVNFQLNQLRQEMETVLLQFQVLLNTAIKFYPEGSIQKKQLSETTDSVEVNKNYKLRFYQQQQLISKAITRVEKSKLLPELTVGYFNTSMKGTGADDRYYGRDKRFQAAQLGIGVPIFAGAQKAKVLAAKVNEEIADSNFQLQKQQLELQIETARHQYQYGVENIYNYEKSVLKNADLIIQTANKQFINGDINYLEWGMLINQSIIIRSNYLDLIKTLNQTVIQLNYLTSKKQ